MHSQLPRFLVIIITIPAIDRQRIYTNDNDKWCLQTALRASRIYFVVYKTACHLVFRTVGPLLVLTVLNCCLAQSLRDAKRLREGITGGGGDGAGAGSAHRKSPTSTAATSVAGRQAGRGGGKQRDNTTTMVVAVICVFIVCELPDIALRLVITAVNLQVHSVF